MVQRYQVKPDDTLGKIAQSYYGKADLWRVIAVANHICDPTKIEPEEWLLIPDFLDEHTVEHGDTFSALALKWYGNADLARYIAMANNRENPHNIGEPGWVAVIPELTEQVRESTSDAPMVSNEVFDIWVPGRMQDGKWVPDYGTVDAAGHWTP